MDCLWGSLLKITPSVPMQSILQSSSQEAEQINRVTNYFFIAAGFMLLIVAALTAYVLYRFRERKANDAKPLSKKWEIPMIGFPLALVGLFFYFSITTLNAIHPSDEGKHPDVIITGHQWWWEANYPSSNVFTANEIHLPVGKTVLLKLLAADVIHDWWVPQFGNKMDMVPTQENYLWVNIQQPGDYYGICSEFCGAQHAHMRIKVVAQTEQDFQSWLSQNGQPASDATTASGKQIFLSKTCGNCHRINGTSANGTTGPDLTHLGSRETLLAGMLENNPQNLEAFLRDPRKIKPEVHMPNFLLDDTTVKAIATYLYSLK